MTRGDALSDADTRYLAEIQRDCEACLGRGIEMLGVRREDADDGVRLVARYRLGEREWESAAVGETVIAAHAALRTRLVVDRIRLGFTALVERA